MEGVVEKKPAGNCIRKPGEKRDRGVPAKRGKKRSGLFIAEEAASEERLTYCVTTFVDGTQENI